MTTDKNKAPDVRRVKGFESSGRYPLASAHKSNHTTDHRQAAKTDTETFIASLFAWSPGWTQIQALKRAVASFRPASDPVPDVTGKRDLYVNACPQRDEHGTGTGKRTADADAAFLAALWVDLDRAGEPGHKTAAALWTVDDVKRLSEWLPVKPTVAVDSGGGWHLWFRLAVPLEFGTDGLAEVTLARWGRWWRDVVAVEFDRQVDAVFNPGRIMRLPGTVNTKEGTERPARILKAYPERSVSLDDLDGFLPAPEPERRTTGPKVDDERPGDRYNREATQSDMIALLEREGFHSPQSKGGRVDLTRPGKNRRDGHSATVWDNAVVTFWSSAIEGLPGEVELRDRNGSTGTYDPFGLYAHLRHGGNLSDAARELAKEYAPPPITVTTSAAKSDPPVDLDVDPLGLMTVDDLLARDMTNPEWLVSGIWPLDSYGAIGAMFKAGKTFLVLDLAVSVAAGDRWCGKWKTPPGPVVVFFGEGGLRKIRRRLEAIARSKGIDLAGLPIHLTPIAPNLTDPDVVAQMIEAVKRIGPRLVIVDPLYLSAPGVKLQLIEVGSLLQPLQVITDLHGAGLVVVHHWNQTGKGSGAERFSGGGLAEWGRVLVSVEATTLAQHEGHSETVLRVEITGDEVAGGVGQFLRTVTVEGDVDDLTAPLAYSMVEQTVPGEVLNLAKPTTSGLVAAALRSGRVATSHELSELFAAWGHKRTADTVYRAAEDLVKRGELDVIEPDDVTGRKRYLMPGSGGEVAA